MTAERIAEGRVLYGLARAFIETCPEVGEGARAPRPCLGGRARAVRLLHQWGLDPEGGGLVIVGVRVRDGQEHTVKCGGKSEVETWIRTDGSVHRFEEPRGTSTIPAFPTIMRSGSAARAAHRDVLRVRPDERSLDRSRLLSPSTRAPRTSRPSSRCGCPCTITGRSRDVRARRGPPRTPRLLHVLRGSREGVLSGRARRERHAGPAEPDHPSTSRSTSRACGARRSRASSCPQYAASDASLMWVGSRR